MEINMENLEHGSENAKVPDSAYSNSSNSQSRRSSKSTQSRSQSSGSSGYGGGKPSTSDSNSGTGQPPEKRSKDKEKKKKQLPPTETQAVEVTDDEPRSSTQEVEETIKLGSNSGSEYFAQIMSPQADYSTEKGSESMDLAPSDGNSYKAEDGFSCVISLHDGIVMYATSSVTVSLGFPIETWIGRSFIKFIHPSDRETFTAQITNAVAIAKKDKALPIVGPVHADFTMVCRIRRYRSLVSSYSVKEYTIKYLPFLLKFSFKNVNDEDGKSTYLVVQAKPLISAFKEANELLPDAVPFVMRHAANGLLEYIDNESVPYLGYIPQDIVNTDALKMYHTDDLYYLAQVYEAIVKKGCMPRSKAYRLMAQNGDYLKVETEWTSFINPWSKKLEFVTGKHHIVQGPTNPDVFDLPIQGKKSKPTEEENDKAYELRISILRILNEVEKVLIKPAEAAKRQMSRRCQDLTTFMESLMEGQTSEPEMRIEILENVHNHPELPTLRDQQDSLMPNAISPDQDQASDSKSSTETVISYNHMNFNENLQRYFESQELFGNEPAENFQQSKNKVNSMSPLVRYFGDSSGMSSDSSGITLPTTTFGENPFKRLTESILTKHNMTMKKEMIKTHREKRTTGEKETSSDRRQKRKEHLARCNATYQPTLSTCAVKERSHHGVKRGSRQTDKPKHHCSSPTRQMRRRKSVSPSPSMATAASTVGKCNSGIAWPTTSMSGVNAIFMGIGVPQQMSILGTSISMPGVIPMCYAAPTTAQGVLNNPLLGRAEHFVPQPVQCMMYGHYGQAMMPVVPINAHMQSFALPKETEAMTMTKTQPKMEPNQLGKPNAEPRTGKPPQPKMGNATAPNNKNHEEQTRATSPMSRKTKIQQAEDRREASQHADTRTTCMATTTCNSSVLTSTNALYRSTEAVPEAQLLQGGDMEKGSDDNRNNDEPNERTDGESSYSSFYSSYFKTDSNSATDSDGKKFPFKMPETNGANNETGLTEDHNKKVQRKPDPPWMEHITLTPELIYKYQVDTKSIEETLKSDKERMMKLEQPVMVNEQLNNLYMELCLNGQPQHLALEEGMTSSSSSSGEENAPNVTPKVKRKREHSRMVMIYEEDAPFPPSPKEGVLMAPIGNEE